MIKDTIYRSAIMKRAQVGVHEKVVVEETLHSLSSQSIKYVWPHRLLQYKERG